MKKVVLITSVDYELFGDGTGDVQREQIDTTNELLKILDPYGVKLTIMFEYAQYCTYNKYAKDNKNFIEDNKKIREQLISLVKNGHDVQLHYHAQWDEAKYNKEKECFTLNLDQVDISSLPYNRIVTILKEGKQFLEELLKPYKPDYECIGFRAGSWAVKEQKKLLNAMKESGLKSDSSVVPNVKFESERVNFEYKNCPYQYHYWYVDDLLTKVGNSKMFIEIPIYTLKSPFAFIKYLNIKFLTSKKIVGKIYRTKLSEKNFSIFQKIKKIVTRDYYMADLNTMSYKTLIKMVEDVINDKQFHNEDIIPLMLICHSKTSYSMDDINLFIDYLQKKYKDKVEFWTYQETISYLLANNKDLNLKKDN